MRNIEVAQCGRGLQNGGDLVFGKPRVIGRGVVAGFCLRTIPRANKHNECDCNEADFMQMAPEYFLSQGVFAE